MSLRLRLLAIIGTSLCLLWGLAATWLAYDLQAQLDRTLDQRLAASARMVAALVQQLPANAWQQTDGPALSIPPVEGIACQVSSPQGEVIARTPTRIGPALEPRSPGYSYRHANGERWRVFTYRANGLTITTADRLDERHALTNDVLLVAATPFIIALASSLALLWWGVRRGLAPLERLRRALAAREPASLKPVETSGLAEELQPLTRTLNQLLDRMNEALAREQRFTSDAAHELRTPLAGIKTHLQVARQARGERAERALQHAEDGTERLASILQQLLMLARLDGGQAWDTAPAGAPEAVISRIVEDLPPADRARIQTDQPAADGHLSAPGELVTAALRNLLTNALKHTPADSLIQVTTTRHDGMMRFDVTDEGPGIEAADLERLTERFWRAGKTNGSGLGLSITAAIVSRVGGKLRFENRHPRGLRARMSVPVSDCAAAIPAPRDTG